MLANQLKGLLTMCADKTDLPMPAMVSAGAKVLLFCEWDDTCGEMAENVWNAMLAALRDDATVRPRDIGEG